MWTTRVKPVPRGLIVKVVHENELTPLAYGDALSLMQESAAFRTLMISELARAPFEAFRWETPPVNLASVDRPFEFVLLDSPGLIKVPNFDAFREYFESAAHENVLAFPNLGNDATLIVPSRQGPAEAYGHLAAFVRGA